MRPAGRRTPAPPALHANSLGSALRPASLLGDLCGDVGRDVPDLLRRERVLERRHAAPAVGDLCLDLLDVLVCRPRGQIGTAVAALPADAMATRAVVREHALAG